MAAKLFFRLGAPFAFVAWVAAGCSTSIATPAAHSDPDSSMLPDGGGGDVGAIPPDTGDDAGSADAGGACNAITDRAVKVEATVDEVDPLPVAAGGVIHDGTYLLTRAAYYNVRDAQGRIIGSGGPPLSFRMTLVITAGIVQTVTQGIRSTGTFTTAGSTWTSHDTCPSNDNSSTAYTATPDEIKTISPSQDAQFGKTGALVVSYTRQP